MEQIEQPQIATVATLSDEKRVAFFKKTYSHVALAVLLFIVAEYFFFQSEAIVSFALSLIGGWSWLLLLGAFMFVTNYAENMALKSDDKQVHYGALLIYVIAEAFIFVPLLFMAFTVVDGVQILQKAAVMTVALFIGLSAVVLFTKKDFSFLRAGLTIGFVIALGLIVAGTLFGFDLGLWFSVGMVALAAGSILYTTSNMVHKYHEEQYVAAALGLFASLMLLFWYILRIFLSRD
ncbi:permease [Dokdonia sinensis]|uniref:Permease n=1 Tax=Dokdonia sinensis TaxID=2479847 RepID=A0A3M0GEJ5_9FLAO|nr:Bax inhibitor-1 family protein [Dokdonia sinensis]RMB62718.1 permease [Dokdonia sinensis]